MATAKEMMTGGISAGAARAINGQVNAAVTAAGSALSDSTELKSGHSVVTTISAGQGVRPENSEIGDEYYIYNATTGLTGVVLTVYPPTSSGTINQLAAGTGMLLAPATAVWLKKASATAWTGNMSA